MPDARRPAVDRQAPAAFELPAFVLKVQRTAALERVCLTRHNAGLRGKCISSKAAQGRVNECSSFTEVYDEKTRIRTITSVTTVNVNVPRPEP